MSGRTGGFLGAQAAGLSQPVARRLPRAEWQDRTYFGHGEQRKSADANRTGQQGSGLCSPEDFLRPLLLIATALLAACQRAPDTRVHIRIWHQKITGERDL